ncbi:putative lipoprotein [Chlamydia pneumoniae LPCoLN]|uniref:Putative lipoprotein n=1 Tax=Chlamydia pneumoniae TaxID=83558 RepID=A0A0F7WWP5_CHLPN|nr:LPS assembly lipoprotein LptE [Chlamydia pneumoniae]ACZ32553.1 putative lipoprotein [Chlamydia pneumoniae LPCoLN]ETR80582.1 hypothetical protein X556_0092 [Chlamydia pneumoniae B21]CRI42789.1 Putative lipoprotein [Chlamydia pneumoniae]
MRLFSLGTIYLFFSLALSSCCGYSILNSPYHLSSLGKSLLQERIFIAPIKEDPHGQLCSALTYELSKRSFAISGRSSCAGYTLKVELLNGIDENIGFTYAPNKLGDKTHRHFIVSNEGRLSLSAKVQLINNDTQEVLIDQCVARESVDFDFEPDLGTANAHEFALGQFEMHSEAIKSARRILSIRLAETIAQQVYYDLF